MQKNNDPKSAPPARRPPGCLPKLCGADMELGNFLMGESDSSYWTNGDAARRLLSEIKGQDVGQQYECFSDSASRWPPNSSAMDQHYGYPDTNYGSTSGYYSYNPAYGSGAGYGYNPQDWGRKFLPSNGGCFYIDLNHLEACIPEVLSAYEHVACCHAMLRIARQAQIDANEKLPVGKRIQLMANNSDGHGHSWGSHLNYFITRTAFENIFHRKMQYLLYLAAYQVSSIVFTGQGKVGSENGRPGVAYQICSRADYFETLVGGQTTFRRPIVNARDEALCGNEQYGRVNSQQAARLHCIFYDHTLCQVAGLLKVGVMQILLAMIEAERINANLILDDPLHALVAWSHDPTLRTRAKTFSGKNLTPVELQMLFLEEAIPFVEHGECDGIVPHAARILALWRDTLGRLRAADLDDDPEAWTPLARRLDWVLKLKILQQAMARHPRLMWNSPEIKHLDHLYSSLDPNEGLYWCYENDYVEKVVSDAQIESFVHEPPEGTRAWTRAMLLRSADPAAVDHVDWDRIRFKFQSEGYWPRYRTLNLDNPRAFTKAESECRLRKAPGLAEFLDVMGVPETDGVVSRATAGERGHEACKALLPARPPAAKDTAHGPKETTPQESDVGLKDESRASQVGELHEYDFGKPQNNSCSIGEQDHEIP